MNRVTMTSGLLIKGRAYFAFERLEYFARVEIDKRQSIFVVQVDEDKCDTVIDEIHQQLVEAKAPVVINAGDMVYVVGLRQGVTVCAMNDSTDYEPVGRKNCPYASHAHDCDCEGAGGDR